MARPSDFYDRAYQGQDYARAMGVGSHDWHSRIKCFVDAFGLGGKKCLEIGCGRGAFQDLVEDYTGIDIAYSASVYVHRPFIQCDATALPFEESSFDAAWTVTVLEHVPDPEKALCEIRRVLKPGGLLFLAPAWQCRSWAASGYPVRPYSDLDLKGKLVKASIPVRDSVAFRLLHVLPRRVCRWLAFRLSGGAMQFRYRRLRPNYERFWMSDSDACNSMDPYEAILWFVSRGDECVTYPTGLARFLVRTGGIVFRIRKEETVSDEPHHPECD